MKEAKLTVKTTHQKIASKALAALFLLQAFLIGVQGNIRVYQGNPPLEVVFWMLTQSTSLIIKVRRAGIGDKEKKKN